MATRGRGLAFPPAAMTDRPYLQAEKRKSRQAAVSRQSQRDTRVVLSDSEELALALADQLAAREGTLSREDVVAWLRGMANEKLGNMDDYARGNYNERMDVQGQALDQAADDLAAGAIEPWLASRAKGGGL